MVTCVAGMGRTETDQTQRYKEETILNTLNTGQRTIKIKQETRGTH